MYPSKFLLDSQCSARLKLMDNRQIARLLREVAAAFTIKNEKKFRFQIIAYERAADAIENSTQEVEDLVKENKLSDLAGVGPSLKSHLEELVKSGHVRHFDEVLKNVPEAVFPLLQVPTFGPKKAYKLVSAFHLKNRGSVISEVKALAEEGKIAALEGFGEKSQSDIRKAIEEYNLGRLKTTRMALPFANELAEQVLAYLRKSKSVIEAYSLGSLRRRRSTIGDIDIAVSTNNAEDVINHFVSYPYCERVIERGERTSSIAVTSGKQIDLMTQEPEGFGSLLQHFTGSKSHNIHLREFALQKGLSLSEYGIRTTRDKILKHYKTEEDFYQAIGLDWIPPEMREDSGEIELASQHKLPKLVQLSDIKGDFHLHSSFPVEPSHDVGQSTMEDMIKKAISLGYEYLGFSEHNPSVSKHSQSETFSLLKKRSKEIERLANKYKNIIRLFSLLEVDILPDGKLALDNDSLALLDGAIVSIHSVFSMDKQRMTERILKGLSHPKAKILAHPTGRLINQRTGYEVDWQKLFNFCQKEYKALEINAWPERLDLPEALVRDAIAQGIYCVINTDSHEVSQMDLMEYGVSVARRGWAKKSDILNTLGYNTIRSWFEK